jgi:hemolysin III
MHLIEGSRAEPLWTQSRAEELANSASHALGLVAAVFAAPLLLLASWQRGGVPFFVGSVVFTATIVVLYFGSTLYHAWPPTRVKGVLQVIDHSAIFLLIAGTYTPLALGPLWGAWGWTILVCVWVLAIFGVALKTAYGVRRHTKLAMALYLTMGWSILFAAGPLLRHVPHRALFWLVAGGIVYTSGVFFFVNERRRYGHFIWHIFVLGGTACHFLAVLSCLA